MISMVSSGGNPPATDKDILLERNWWFQTTFSPRKGIQYDIVETYKRIDSVSVGKTTTVFFKAF